MTILVVKDVFLEKEDVERAYQDFDRFEVTRQFIYYREIAKVYANGGRLSEDQLKALSSNEELRASTLVSSVLR